MCFSQGKVKLHAPAWPWRISSSYGRLNNRLDRVEGRTQRSVEAVPLGHESRRVVTHRYHSAPVLPDQDLERKIQCRERRREHHRCALSRVPKHDEFRIGHLQTNSFGCAAVIDDPKQRKAPNLDEAFQSVDGLCEGLAAELGYDQSEDCALSTIRIPSLRSISLHICPDQDNRSLRISLLI